MQSLICLTQFFERRFEEGLVFDSLSRAQGCQSVQPHADANCRWLFLWKRIREFHLDGDKPPVCRFGNPCACHLPFETEILGHIHPSKSRYPEALITQFQLIVGQIKARLTALLALETRAAGLACKEGRKRFAQIEKGLV